MDISSKQIIIQNYSNLFAQHGDKAEGVQNSTEGQKFRFEKLAEIGDMSGKSVVDVGCGLGHLYQYLNNKYPQIDYTGIDIVPDTIRFAKKKYPGVRFECRDILENPLGEKFDYGILCGVFNNVEAGSDEFLFQMITAVFDVVKIGMGFNFTSTQVNFRNQNMAYHNPEKILKYVRNKLSPKASLFHHYQRCDVAIFVFK